MLAHPRRFSPERLSGLTRDLLSLLPVDARPRGKPAPTLRAGVTRGSPPSSTQGGASTGGRMPRAQRREQLLDVTLALLAQEGFDALSVEAVARRACVNRVVVYRSFANLQGLLVALLRREDARTRTVLEGLLPASPEGRTPAQLLGDGLAGFLGAVVDQPQTWRVALLRPKSAPLALQKLVNRRRSQLTRRLEPLVRWGLAGLVESPTEPDIELLARMLLSIGEEQGRLALDDPDFPPQRLLASSWTLLDALPLES